VIAVFNDGFKGRSQLLILFLEAIAILNLIFKRVIAILNLIFKRAIAVICPILKGDRVSQSYF